jgi:hypothetical protein
MSNVINTVSPVAPVANYAQLNELLGQQLEEYRELSVLLGQQDWQVEQAWGRVEALRRAMDEVAA